MIALELINEQCLFSPTSAQFQKWLNTIADKLKISGEVCIKILSSDESRFFNLTYRSKDKPTNVLSFPAEVPDYVKSAHLGDLAICTEVVEQEAINQNKELEHHWAHMTIHGVLHLLGYDHLNDEDADEMESLEIKLLQALSIDNPYL